MKLCGDDGGLTKDGRPCRANTKPPTMTRCRRHPRNATPEELARIPAEMGREGGLAAAKARLEGEPLDLSTPSAQQSALECVVGAALNGKLNARAAQAIVSAVSVSPEALRGRHPREAHPGAGGPEVSANLERRLASTGPAGRDAGRPAGR
jgi:hypothetical protein